MTFCEDILNALKEDLIYSLVLPQNYDPKSISLVPSSQGIVDDPRKRHKRRKSFGKFPQTVSEAAKPISLPSGKEKKLTRAEWTINNHPDFDIFIDDNPCTLQELVNFYPNKTFVIPDYKMNREVKGENIYRFPVEPINLTNQNFSLASLEYRLNKLEQGISTLKINSKGAKPSSFPVWLIFLLGIGVCLSLVLVLCSGKEKKKRV